jgi:hypothetical protein
VASVEWVERVEWVVRGDVGWQILFVKMLQGMQPKP